MLYSHSNDSSNNADNMRITTTKNSEKNLTTSLENKADATKSRGCEMVTKPSETKYEQIKMKPIDHSK